MKKILSIALTGAIALSGGAYCLSPSQQTSLTASAAEEKYQMFYYEVSYDKSYVTITDTVDSLSGEVVIPEKIDNIPVKEIRGNTLYYDGAFEKMGMTTIVFPSTLYEIKSAAFRDCENLEYLTVPENVEKIGDNAFSGCGKMLYIIFENPYCDISQEENTIPKNAIIYGYKDSTAQAYAELNDREFRLIGEDLPVISEETTTAPVSATTTDTTTATTTVAVETETLKGDANGDGDVTIADAVAILQYLANSDEYPLSEQGAKNADVLGDDGVNTEDALQIQKLDAGVIETL